MSIYQVMLYLHLVAMGVLFGAMGVFQLAVRQVRAGRDVASVRASLGAMARLKVVFPACAAVLLVTGIEMARSHEVLGHGWVVMSLLGVLLLSVLGPVVNAPWGKRVGMALARVGSPVGPLPDSVREAAMRPSVMISSYFSAGVALGIVGVMVARPVGMLPAAATLLAGGLVGVLLALRFVRTAPHGSALPAGKPAA